MRETNARALIWVQHLLGTGHVVRASAIANALVSKGVEVKILSGNIWPKGVSNDGFEIEELPPVRTKDASFKTLVHPDGTPVDEAWRALRKQSLQAAFDRFKPDIMLTETFPMGRRALRHELVPLLSDIKRRTVRPLIVSSVRDILVVKNDPEKDRFMADTLNWFYDLLLVHADPEIITLDETFPLAHEIEGKIAYSGYVRSNREYYSVEGSDGTNEVIVSCGGGAVGLSLLKAALEAKPLSSAHTHTWRFLVGHNVSEADYTSLHDERDTSVIIERSRPDFPALLKRARLSISQAGYNTVLDILAAKVPAVLVPFSQEEENEQEVRARLLKERGLATIAAEQSLSPARLAKGIDEALLLAPQSHQFETNGAQKSAEIILEGLSKMRFSQR